MITIPKHIQEMVKVIEVELEEQLKEEWNIEMTKYKLRQIRDIRNQLQTQDGKLFEDKDEYSNSIGIMEAIMDSCSELPIKALNKILITVEIEPELSAALKHAQMVQPRMRKEIDTIISFLENVPNSSWGQRDSYDAYKIFKLVKTKNEWDEIMKKCSGQNLGVGMTDMPDFKYVQIGYVKTETISYDLRSASEKAKKDLIRQYGQEYFEDKRYAFEKWFRIGRTGIYYIYVPK